MSINNFTNVTNNVKKSLKTRHKKFKNKLKKDAI